MGPIRDASQSGARKKKKQTRIAFFFIMGAGGFG